MVEFKFYNVATDIETLIEARHIDGYYSGQYDKNIVRAEQAEDWVVTGSGSTVPGRVSIEISIRTTDILPAEKLTELENEAKSATSIRCYINGALEWERKIQSFISMKVNRHKRGWWKVSIAFMLNAMNRLNPLIDDGGADIVTDTGDKLVYAEVL